MALLFLNKNYVIKICNHLLPDSTAQKPFLKNCIHMNEGVILFQLQHIHIFSIIFSVL